MGAEARLRGWSEVARSRRGALSLGCRNGDSPLRSPVPSPPLFFFLFLSLVCKCISISYDLFGLLLFPHYDLPLPDSLPLSHLLPLSVSLYLCFPHPLLPNGPSCLHLNPSSSLRFFYSLSLFISFFLRERERWVLDSWGKKSSPVVGIAAPVKLTALCRKSNSHLLCLVLVLDTYAHSSYPLFNFFSCACRSLNISVTFSSPGFTLDNSFAWGFCKAK